MTTLFHERQSRDAAIDRLEVAYDRWIESAVEVIRRLAQSRRDFTTDDVWDGLRGMEPPEARAMGAAMRRAKSLGLIDKTGKYENTRRTGCHARPVPVWRGC